MKLQLRNAQLKMANNAVLVVSKTRSDLFLDDEISKSLFHSLTLHTVDNNETMVESSDSSCTS